MLINQPVLPPPSVRPKVVRTAQLSRPLEQARQVMESEPRMGPAVRTRRLSALEFLSREAVPVNVSWVYAASATKLADLEKLAVLGLVQLGETEIWRDPLRDLQAPAFDPPVLTRAQEEALEKIDRGLEASSRGGTPKPALLHGVTGSGKTEIYLKAIEHTLAKGKQAIVLVPEIALTPQTVRRLLARFPGRVGLIHSRLSPGERYDTWRRARDGNLDVILGPRSALFTPLPNLGLIVVDECHEGSYYQDDLPPSYHAVDAALALARLTRSEIILGSATPSVEMVQQANQEGWDHSSVERVVFPDAFIVADYAAHRLNELLMGLTICREQMLKNVELSKGQLFSSHVLLALVDKGLSREAAYKIVQRLSHSLGEHDHLKDVITKDAEAKKLLSAKELNDIFSGKRHLMHTKNIIKNALKVH